MNGKIVSDLADVYLRNLTIYFCNDDIKPGPLSDDAGRLDDLADVYRRGLEEVGALFAGVRARPG